MSSTKVLFIGTSEFAVPILKKLTELEFVELVGVVTQPDRAVGRHHSELQPSEVGKWAEESISAKIHKPENLKKEAVKILDETQPELIIVASYGQIIPRVMLEYPKYGCINVHASLLPKLRGAVPIPMAILEGLDKTGVSFQKMVEKLDAGEIIAKFEIGIADDETTESLTGKLSKLAAEKLDKIIEDWINGEIKAKPQEEIEATYCSQGDIAKTKAQLLPETAAKQADGMIRAFYPWPITWGFINLNGAKKRLRIFEVKLADIELDNEDIKRDRINIEQSDILIPKREGDKLLLPLKNGILELLDIQLEGKERKPASEYLFIAQPTD